jgi:hypothetical protein
MNTQHTPGPWKIGCNLTDEEAIIGPKNQVVVDAAWLGGSACKLSIDNEADARLITAAPDLLDALQICEGNISSLLASAHPKVYGEWLDVVSAAIAKATRPA